MSPTKTASITSRYETGLLSASEAAYSILHDLLSETELDTAFLSSMGSLPGEIVQEFRCLLNRIEEDDFQWRPFLLASPDRMTDPAILSARLRRVYDLIR